MKVVWNSSTCNTHCHFFSERFNNQHPFQKFQPLFIFIFIFFYIYFFSHIMKLANQRREDRISALKCLHKQRNPGATCSEHQEDLIPSSAGHGESEAVFKPCAGRVEYWQWGAEFTGILQPQSFQVETVIWTQAFLSFNVIFSL